MKMITLGVSIIRVCLGDGRKTTEGMDVTIGCNHKAESIMVQRGIRNEEETLERQYSETGSLGSLDNELQRKVKAADTGKSCDCLSEKGSMENGNWSANRFYEGVCPCLMKKCQQKKNMGTGIAIVSRETYQWLEWTRGGAEPACVPRNTIWYSYFTRRQLK